MTEEREIPNSGESLTRDGLALSGLMGEASKYPDSARGLARRVLALDYVLNESNSLARVEDLRALDLPHPPEDDNEAAKRNGRGPK